MGSMPSAEGGPSNTIDASRASLTWPGRMQRQRNKRHNWGLAVCDRGLTSRGATQLGVRSRLQGRSERSPIIAKTGGSHFIPPGIWRTISANCRQFKGGIAHPPPDLANSQATSSPKSGGVTLYPPGSGEPPFVARATNAASTPRGPSSPPPRSPSHTS